MSRDDRQAPAAPSRQIQHIVALAEEEGQPLSWWTGDVDGHGRPIGTAAYTLAFPFKTAEKAREAAEHHRLPGAWRVQPMAVTMRAARD